jgi:hypothetical protein
MEVRGPMVVGASYYDACTGSAVNKLLRSMASTSWCVRRVSSESIIRELTKGKHERLHSVSVVHA